MRNEDVEKQTWPHGWEALPSEAKMVAYLDGYLRRARTRFIRRRIKHVSNRPMVDSGE